MAKKNPIDFMQDRRHWLKTSATMVGASLMPTAVIAEQAPQAAAKPAAAQGHKAAGPARFFTPAQHALVEELTETIIPADSHSGGAKAAKVADFIDKTLRESFEDDKKATWQEGLRLIDLMSLHYNGKKFLDASPEDRIALLTVLCDNEKMTDLPEVRFFVDVKHLTVLGYYTSKVGIHDELEYKGNRILKEYVGCDDPGTGA